MPVVTEVMQPMAAQLRVAHVAPAVGNNAAAAAELEWDKSVRLGVSLYAYMKTLIQRVGEETVTQIMGPETMAELEGLLMQFRVNAEVAAQLSTGQAVVILYQDSSELQPNAVRVGVYKAQSQGDLGVVWAYVALAAGAVLVGAYMVMRNWDTQGILQQEKTKQLALETAQKVHATVAEVAKTDPAAAARIAEAGAEAIREATKAAAAPKSWVQEMLGGLAAGAGMAVPLLLALFAWMSFQDRKAN